MTLYLTRFLKQALGLTLTLCISTLSFSQSDTLRDWLTGTWILSSHSVEEYTGNSNLLSDEQRITLIFDIDGTYQSIGEFPHEGKVDEVITVGQWELDGSAENNEVYLYDNRFVPPHDRDGQVADHPMPLLKATRDSLWTTECLFFEDPPGVSLYIRTSN